MVAFDDHEDCTQIVLDYTFDRLDLLLSQYI